MARKQLKALAACILVWSLASTARADLYGFDNITHNNAVNAGIGEDQLFVEVTASGADQVLFEFANIGLANCSITDVYFDDGNLRTLLDVDWIDNSDPGVLFSQGASPGNLPGGNSIAPPFVTTLGLSADADSPPAVNGVNPGELLGIILNLQSGFTFADVIADIASGDLRVGIHVQAFDNGGSESFVNPPEPVPAPGAALLGMMGMGMVGWFKKRWA